MVTRRAPGRKKTSSRGGRPARRARGGGGAPARGGGLWVAAVLGALVLVNLYVFVWNKSTSVSAVRRRAEGAGVPAELGAAPLAGGAGATDGGAAAAATSGARISAPQDGVTARPAGAAARAAAGRGHEPAAAPIAPPGVVEGKIGKGDSLGRVLKRSGLGGGETDEVIRALAGALDFRGIKAGQAFRVERGADGKVALFELDLGHGQLVRAERQAGGRLVGAGPASAAAPDRGEVDGDGSDGSEPGQPAPAAGAR